jgi:hypothetical protein
MPIGPPRPSTGMWGRIVPPPAVPQVPGGQGVPPNTPSTTPAPTGGPVSADGFIAKLISALGRYTQRSILLYVPDTFPIPGATEFQLSGSVATSSPGVVAVTPILTLPPHNVGIIRTFNIGTSTAITTATNQVYTVWINGGPGVGTQRTYAGRGAINYERSFDTGFRIPDGGTVQVFVNNVDGGSYTDFADVVGWYHNTTSVKRWLEGRGTIVAGV